MTDKTLHIRRWTKREDAHQNVDSSVRDEESKAAIIAMMRALGFTDDDKDEIERMLRVDPLPVKPASGKELVDRYHEFGFTVEDGEDLERFLRKIRKEELR